MEYIFENEFLRCCHKDKSGLLSEEELDRAHGYATPSCLEQCPLGPAQWEHICRLKAIEEATEEAHARGLGCKRQRELTCASDVVLDCGCSGCVEWREFMKKAKPASAYL